MATRKRRMKRKVKGIKSNISSAKSFQMLQSILRLNGKVPKFDPLTGKKLNDYDQLAIKYGDVLDFQDSHD